MPASKRGSIVFRLWATLSLIATLFTVLAFSLYVLLATNDAIASTQRETDGKINASLVSAARLGATGQKPNALETETASDLGIVRIDVLDDAGAPRFAVDFGDHGVDAPALSPELLAHAKAGKYSRSVQIANGIATPTRLSNLKVIAGGRYGEEQIIPLSTLGLDQGGYVRIIGRFQDLSMNIHDLVRRAISLSALIVGMTLLCMWPFLQHLLGRPLRRYSELALQIAAGNPVRMPANGQDELGELGRAVNGMADALRHQATVDPLTGLYNLRHLSSNLETLVAEATDSGAPLCLILGDLDGFKPINDTYGHQAGDRVLQAVGEAIRTWGGHDSTCWRLGGDEFVVALPDTTETDGISRATQLRKVVGGLTFSLGNGVAPVRTSMSVGVASYPEDADTAPALLSIADRRMYMAKTVQQQAQAVIVGAA